MSRWTTVRVKEVLRLADIVIDALTMAWFRKTPTPGLIHHSDRGSLYASHAFQARLTEYGMVCSMTARGIAATTRPQRASAAV